MKSGFCLILSVLCLAGCGLNSRGSDHCVRSGKMMEKIHYIERGKGDPVVLLHGAGANLNEFISSGLVEALESEFRVIAIDRPGLGFSERSYEDNESPLFSQVQSVHRFLEKKGIKKPILVGHSMGAGVALGYAARYPQNISGVVSIAGAISPVGTGRTWYSVLSTTPVVGLVFNHTVVPFFGPILLPGRLKHIFAPNPIPDGYVRKSCLAMLFQPKHFYNNSSDLNEIVSFLGTSKKLYDQIDSPISLIFGKSDTILAVDEHLRLFLEEAPESRVHILENVGHLPHHFHQDLVLSEIQKMHQSMRKL